ncbi:MAG: carbohydrate ABC transporter permease [Spirochaetaceae bacterium]|nr:carbohydrate ABC transporter permease [Spirochaetaceae bacterium]
MKRSISAGIIHGLLVISSLTTAVPFIWMILTSFKTYEESIHIPMIILPSSWNFDNFTGVLAKFPFNYFYTNTFLMMAVVVVGQLIICSLAAYAFARLRFPGRDLVFLLCLSLMMVPGQIFLIPRYSLMVKWRLTDTLTALWLPRLFSVFGVFMLRQFFSALPRELDEAAKIDGCSYWGIYRRVLLPLIKPGLVSLGILIALDSWKDLMWPLIVNTDMKKQTLSAGLAYLIGEHTTIYPLVMAGGLLAAAPMIILFFIFQRYFIEGIALSGIKL